MREPRATTPIASPGCSRDVKVIDMNKDGDITKTQLFPELRIDKWSETPWRLASSDDESRLPLRAELNDYLRHNADFPAARLAPYRTQLQNRWALPWSPLIVVFIAAPLGIVYSRRGILGSVSLARSPSSSASSSRTASAWRSARARRCRPISPHGRPSYSSSSSAASCSGCARRTATSASRKSSASRNLTATCNRTGNQEPLARLHSHGAGVRRG